MNMQQHFKNSTCRNMIKRENVTQDNVLINCKKGTEY